MCSVTKKIAKKKHLKFKTHTMLARPPKVGKEPIVKVQKKRERVVHNNDPSNDF